MGNWIIRWNFNKASYELGQSASVSFWLENTGDTYVYLSHLGLEFDFGTYNLETISGMVSPRATRFLGNVNLILPPNVVGMKLFRLRYRIYDYISNNWIDLGTYQSEEYFISVYPQPFYKVFVSRGLHPEDRVVGDPIAEMVREWGFETVTIGIEIQVPDEEVATRAREEIKSSDAVVAVATPRFIDALTGLWKTLEWHHGEVGIAFGVDKPLLILKDKRVALGGLPSYLLQSISPLIEFDSYALDALRASLSTIMPGLREWIETNRRQNFFESLGKIVIGGLAVIGAVKILGGNKGALPGTSKK